MGDEIDNGNDNGNGNVNGCPINGWQKWWW